MARIPAPDSSALPPPRRGEWRSLYRERPQSFDEFVAHASSPGTGSRNLVVLQPLGSVADRYPGLLEAMREYAFVFFGLETRLGRSLPLPEAAHVPQRDQYNSSMVLDDLTLRIPPEARAFLGIADRDLFARGTRYVFGESNAQTHSGVCSLARLQSPDPGLLARRALKLMSHETGHLLSIAHCVTSRCVMQGANTLEEADGHPMELCRTDLRKLAWSTGIDPRERRRALAAFGRRMGWPEDE